MNLLSFQTTQFKVACSSKVGDVVIHIKMVVNCEAQTLSRLVESNFNVVIVIEIRKL